MQDSRDASRVEGGAENGDSGASLANGDNSCDSSASEESICMDFGLNSVEHDPGTPCTGPQGRESVTDDGDVTMPPTPTPNRTEAESVNALTVTAQTSTCSGLAASIFHESL